MNMVRAAVMISLFACDDGKPAGVDPMEATDTGTDTDTDTDTDVSTAPTNLALTVTLDGTDDYNPSGDGSGVVRLLAVADGAERFVFEIADQGELDSPSGELSHSVTVEGTHTYDITVTALSETGEHTSITESVDVYYSTDMFRTVVWADEFDIDGAPDAERWHHQVLPPDNGGWYNGELQHYTDRAENASVSDGTLKIVALREDYTTEGALRRYTSARLNARFAFTYGRVEVRARLPAAAGTWPAIWTLGANINERGNVFGDQYGSVGWPACGEIDIMEQRGWDKGTTLAHFHWGDTVTGAYDNEGGYIDNATSTTNFHVYALRWTEDALTITVDGQRVYELANTAARPYDDPHYILLNIAMGGALGGAVPGDFTQATMEVDYIRIYQ
jgi:beta-glucanase (GH16 family)